MEYALPSLVAICGVFFLMWQRAASETQRLLRRGKAIEEAGSVAAHTSTIMKDVITRRNAQLIDLAKERDRRHRELQGAASDIASTTNAADVAAAWNQEI